MTGIYDSRGEEYTLTELRVVLRQHDLKLTTLAEQKVLEACERAALVKTVKGDLFLAAGSNDIAVAENDRRAGLL